MCGHINSDNERDCEKTAVAMCICCAEPVCEEHLEKRCPYGGELYIDLEEGKYE
jgi:hypothetical protein